MNNIQTLYCYMPEGQLCPVMDLPDKLLVADSFLVDNGMARAPELHATRFLKSCRALAGIDAEDIARFWQLAMQQIPAQGQWFPRLELVGSKKQPRLQLRLRSAPERHTQARLIYCDTQDRRTCPRHKGPDIQQLAAQRKSLSAKGADEGILCTPSHYLLEGLSSSTMWWENDILCQTPPSKRVLPSVTAELVKQVAISRGIPVAYRFRRCHELNDCDTWAVNALHGIRQVVNWPLAPWRISSCIDHHDWQHALNHHALRPIHP